MIRLDRLENLLLLRSSLLVSHTYLHQDLHERQNLKDVVETAIEFLKTVGYEKLRLVRVFKIENEHHTEWVLILP